MIEQELKKIWRKSSQIDQVKFDLSKLLIELNNTMTNVEKSIQARDRREIVAAIIGIPVFAYFAYEIPFPITKIACIFAVFFLGYVIYKLRSVRKHLPSVNLSSSFRDQLAQQKHYLLKQQELLNTVLYWYVLPPFLMNIVFIIGLGDPAAYDWSPSLLHLLPITMHEKVTTVIGLALFYGFIVWVNRRAARKSYGPVIEDIERVQRQLEDDAH